MKRNEGTSMNVRKNRPATLKLSIAIAIVCTVVFLLSRKYPMTTGSKDWLDISSALGQAAGVLVLVGLLLEMNQRDLEEKQNRTPTIVLENVKWVHGEEIPEGAVACLTEKNAPPASLDKRNSYHTIWEMLAPQNSSHYLRVEIANKQIVREGEAQNFQIQIEFTYGEGESEKTDRAAKECWCPPEGVCIPPGGKQVFYIRSGQPIDKRLTHVTGKIMNYKCNNLQGDSFLGSDLGFEPRKLTRGSLTIDHNK